MCHLNDALACPSDCPSKQKSRVLIQLPGYHAFGPAFRTRQIGDVFASFPCRADFSPHASVNAPHPGAPDYTLGAILTAHELAVSTREAGAFV